MKLIKHHKMRAVQAFNINLQLYLVILTFLALLYSSRSSPSFYWPLYAAIVWGVVLLLQFLWVYRGAHHKEM